MKIKVIWDPKAVNNLRKLDRNISKRIVEKMDRIQLNHKRYILSLVNMNVSKIRVGDYRIFVNYYEKDSELIIRAIKHRKNAYKNEI